MKRENLKGMTLDELQGFVQALGEKKYRSAQLFSWLYAKGAQSFDDMSDISKDFREVLKKSASLEHLNLIATNRSTKDGTTKFLFKLTDGVAVESVLIPPEETSPTSGKRLTLCLSTQVGCPLDCKFCATGTMGFARNLTAGEIIDQVIQTQRQSIKRITNIVYMGMGEPMLNFESVMKSVDILTDDRSLNIGARHITISTAGYADKIRRMADDNRKVKLAVSLHSLDNEQRAKLMPITRKFTVDVLLDSLEYFYRKTKSRPTFEYILFDGFNDKMSDLKKLIQISKRIPSKVNLIPFHSIDFTHPSGFASTLKPAPAARMEEFANSLRRANITVMVRSSAGEDINAACGQLAVATRQLRARPRASGALRQLAASYST